MPVSHNSIIRRVLLLAVAATMVACQIAPVQEMSDARQALAAAKDAGAEQYAADIMQQAVDRLQSAERLLSEHKYTQARQDALDAKSAAIEALQRTASGKENETR